MHQSYKPPNSWRILFWSGGCPSQFSNMKHFRALVFPVGVCHKRIILQGSCLPSDLPVIGQSCLRIKVDLTGASLHAPRHRNSVYVNMVIPPMYETRWTKKPHTPIHRYKRLPKGPTSRPRYRLLYLRQGTHTDSIFICTTTNSINIPLQTMFEKIISWESSIASA